MTGTLEVGQWVSESEQVIELRKFKYGWRATILDRSMNNSERKVKSTEAPEGLHVYFARGEDPVLLPWPNELPTLDIEDPSAAAARVTEEAAAAADAPAPRSVPSPPATGGATAAAALQPWPTLPRPATEVARDRFGRPLIVPPDGGKKTPYTRCTTYVGALEDTYKLSQWQQRQVARGMADRPDLQLAAIAHGDDRDELQRIADAALESARAGAKATTGTALHALTELVDQGQPLPPLPDGARRDLAAYRSVAHGLSVLAVEVLTVRDDIKVAGTPDRVVEYEGGRYIADLKTGSIDFGLGKIAMQLAVYSRSVAYDHESGTRTPLPDVDQDRGIIIHQPQGTGTARLLWVDLAAGWEAVQVAGWVRKWRNRKNLTEEWEKPALEEAIASAPDLLALEGLYWSRQDEWSPDHTLLAQQRKQTLTEGSQP